MFKKILLFLLFFTVFCSVASAWEDTCERYPNGVYTDYWTLTTDSSNTGAALLYDSTYHTTALNLVLSGVYSNMQTSKLTTNGYIVNPSYFSFVTRSGDGYAQGIYIKYVNSTTGLDICSIALNPATNKKYELIWDTNSVKLYTNGTLTSTTSATYQSNVLIQLYYNGQNQHGNMEFDDFTTSSTIGLPELFFESSDNLQFTYSAELIRSYTTPYTISLYSLSNTNNAGKIKSWTIYNTSEHGEISESRATLLENNYGLYLLEMTRGDVILTDQYFYYDDLANPVGYPDVIMTATGNVDMDIRDADNNGGETTTGNTIYLFPSENSSGIYPITCDLKENPAGFTTSFHLVYGEQNVNSVPITFSNLGKQYIISLDGTPITGAQAGGILTFNGSVTDGETVTIGADIYEFNNSGGITAGHIEVSPGSNVSESASNLVSKINTQGTELVSSTYTNLSSAPSYSVGYNYHAPINVTNSSSTEGVQTKITIPYRTGMKSNFDDIRFKTSTGTDIPYWIESKTDSSTALVWLKLPASQSTIYLVYGNNSATSNSNGTAVFELYEDWENGLPVSGWTNYNNNGVVSNGVLALDGQNGGNYYSTATFGTGYALESRIRTTVGSGTSDTCVGFGVGDTQVTSSTAMTTTYMQTYWSVDSKASTYTYTANEWVRMCTYRTSAGNSFMLLGGSTYAGGTGVSTAYPVMLHGFFVGSGEMQVDWVAVRKYVDNTPALSLGTSSACVCHQVAVISDSGGADFNLIATTETCAYAAWEASTLTGGVDGSDINGTTWTYTLTDWTITPDHVFIFAPDLSKPGIYGYVKDSDTNYPLARASVKLTNSTSTEYVFSDSNGLFYTTNSNIGDSVTVSASKTGYSTSGTYTAIIKAGETTRQDIYLTPNSATQNGAGLYYAPHDVGFSVWEYWYSGIGLSGVTYTVYNGSTVVASGTSDSKGMFTLINANTGTNYTIEMQYGGKNYTEFIQPSLYEYTLVLNKEGTLHQYVNSWLTLNYTENTNNVTVQYTSNKTVSGASLVVKAENGTVVSTQTLTTDNGTFTFVTGGNGGYTLNYDILASDGSTAKMSWGLNYPTKLPLFPDSYPDWLKNTLYVGILLLFLLAFGKSRSDVACGSVAVMVSMGYYFEWLICSFNLVILVWVIALGAVYLHYKRTGGVG